MKLSVSLPEADHLHGGCGKGWKESSQRGEKGEKEKSKGSLCGHGLGGYSVSSSAQTFARVVAACCVKAAVMITSLAVRKTHWKCAWPLSLFLFLSPWTETAVKTLPHLSVPAHTVSQAGQLIHVLFLPLFCWVPL